MLEPEEDGEDSVISIVNFLNVEKTIDNQKLLMQDGEFEAEDKIIYKILNDKRKIWVTEEFGMRLVEKVHINQGYIGFK